MAYPDLHLMPVEQLRAWTPEAICLVHARVVGVRIERDEAAKVLRAWLKWEPGITMFQMTLPRGMIERDLGRWVPDGWTVVTEVDGWF